MKTESFTVTKVSRADLEGIGFDTSGIDDATMQHLAEKMGSDYVEQLFWVHLPMVAEYIGIPMKDDRICEDFKNELKFGGKK